MNVHFIARIEKMYKALQDDISRQLFNYRLDAFLPPPPNNNLVDEILPKGLILYGAGWAGVINLNILKSKGFYNVIYFCDSAPAKWGTEVENISVISPKELMEKHRDKAVLVSTTNFYAEIHGSLINMCVASSKI